MDKAWMKKIGSLAIVLGAAGLLWFWSSHGTAVRGNRDGAEHGFFAMDTYFTVNAYGIGCEEAVLEAEEETKRLEQLLSVTVPESDLWRINHAHGQPVAVDGDTISVLTEAVAMGALTQGALDISVYPVLQAWGFTVSGEEEFQIPSEQKLRELLVSVDYQKVQIGETAVSVPDGMQIDLGAIAKGYTGDRLTELFRSRGITSALLNLGHNVQTIGERPDGTPWKIGVTDPFEPQEILGVVEVTDKVVITSGNYERYFEKDGRRYCHILDPATGHPAQSGLVSVTVIGESGTYCDALSTAIFVMGREKGVSLWREQGDFELILVEEDGSVFITEGLRDCFLPESGHEVTEVLERVG